jgi:aminoglycoside phosphotransferase (APT) family kinase protein
VPWQDSGLSVVHGDYRLDNVIADLGTTMAYWHDDGDEERYLIPVAAGVTAWPGFPTAAGLAEMYAKASGSEPRDLGFYLALGTAKLAVILEGVHARYLGGRGSGPGYATAGPAVPVLVARAMRQLSAAA